MHPYGNYKKQGCTCFDCGGGPAPDKGAERLKAKREIEKELDNLGNPDSSRSSYRPPESIDLQDRPTQGER